MMPTKLLPQLTEAEQSALNQFLTRLEESFPQQVRHVILFGSRARGDSTSDSDIDLYIVLNSDDWRMRGEISGLALAPMLEHNTLLSTHTVGGSHYEKIRRMRTTFYRNLESEGIELWTR
jgi:predicted nucleotidyltransferase